MRQDGFSLIELIVVLGIISILLSVAALSYNDWQVKYNVEKQTKELLADINSFRLRAIHTKSLHRVVLQPGGYVLRRTASEDEVYEDGPVVESKTLRYEIRKVDGSSIAGETIDFDSRGYTSNPLTIRVESPKNNAALDCVIVSNARTNMGKIEDGECKPK